MTQDEIIEMAREAGFNQRHNSPVEWWMFSENIETFAKLVAAKEREACAKLCEEPWQGSPKGIAEQIRARGEQA